MAQERLQKFMAECGVASRRACESLITAGLVKVNGTVVTELGTKIDPAIDQVEYQGSVLKASEVRTTVILNKPAGYVTTSHDQFGRPNVTELIDLPGVRLYPVGRLDYQTTGLLLLTNDGDLAYYLTHPGSHVPKVYQVQARGEITKEEMQQLENGIVLEDGTRTSPCRIKPIRIKDEVSRLEMTIYEGKNHEVRRMMKAVGHPVLSLRRVQEGNLRLGSLKEGSYRILSEHEVQVLKGEKPKS